MFSMIAVDLPVSGICHRIEPSCLKERIKLVCKFNMTTFFSSWKIRCAFSHSWNSTEIWAPQQIHFDIRFLSMIRIKMIYIKSMLSFLCAKIYHRDDFHSKKKGDSKPKRWQKMISFCLITFHLQQVPNWSIQCHILIEKVLKKTLMVFVRSFSNLLTLKASDYIFLHHFFSPKKKSLLRVGSASLFFFRFAQKKLSQKKSSKQIDWPIRVFQPRPAHPSFSNIKRAHFFATSKISFFLLSFHLLYKKEICNI